MAGFLTTHVLDTGRGTPAAGLEIKLFRLGATREHLATVTTNADGRTDAPILPSNGFKTGSYELIFMCGDYLRRTSASDAFLDEIPIRFSMQDDSHYHVPLLLSPFGYSTYRGS